ncbi:MAG: RNA polymerase sigma factor [Parasporobacterium sp.]|nr:RNA polymerase sigma factor [Parasporobacterium sp.]
MTDQEFYVSIRKMQAGDREGLREVYEAYNTFIYSLTLSVLKNKENAEDVTTDFFIKLWDISGTFIERGGHKTWMATIARNMSIDFLRKNVREIATEEMDDQRTTESAEREALGTICFADAMKMIDGSEAEIINMKIVGQLTFKEIAEMLNMPMGTVTWKYQNGIKKLKKVM